MKDNFFISRPVFATVIALLILLVGTISIYFLPIAQFPKIVPPQVQITANYPGASAEVVAQTVTTPIEEQVNGVEGMLYMSSNSTNDGNVKILITFKVGYDQDIAAVDVQNRLENAKPFLPQTVIQNGIQINKVSSEMTLVVNLLSPNGTYDSSYLGNYADIHITDPLARIAGVGQVLNFGLHKYAMRIWLDPNKMADLGVSATEIKEVIKDQNDQVVAGKVGQPPVPEGQVHELTINALGRLTEVSQFEDIILRTDANGAVVRLKDVARVELGAQDYTSTTQFNGQATATLGIYQLPDANAVAIANQAEALMEQLAERFPPDMTYTIAYDTTDFVRASLVELVKTLVIALLLVMLVVFVFLQNWRATLIPFVAIPVALIGTFAIMLPFGFSINTLSLFGLVLAIGLVVDDAIIVVENVQRQMQQSTVNLRQAAQQAMAEVTSPIIATTLVLLAVFIPTAFMPGIVGQLYNQFALTIAFAVALSGIVSLTLSPALCALVLRPAAATNTRFADWFNQHFTELTQRYQVAVDYLIKRWCMVLAGFVGLIVLTGYLLHVVPTGFVPEEDQGYFIVTVQMPAGTALQQTESVVERVEAMLHDTAGVDAVLTVAGFDLLTEVNLAESAFIFAILNPWDQRKAKNLHVDALIKKVQSTFATWQDAQVIAFNAPPIPGLGTVGGFEMELQDVADLGSQELAAVTQEFLRAANQRPELEQVSSTFAADAPQIYLDIDRTKIRLLDTPISEVFDTLQIYMGSLYVNDFNEFGRTYRVILQAEEEARRYPEQVLDLYVRNVAGQMLPLSTVMDLHSMLGPNNVPHYNLYASASVQANHPPQYSTGQAIQAMNEVAAEVLPETINATWTGLVYQQLIAGNLAPLIFLLSLTAVFLFLAAQYESWVTPLVILLVVPLAVLGAALALLIRQLALDIYAQIGLILLIGLAAKNAILIVEFARDRRAQGVDIVAAIREAAKLRLRPILMTAFAFIFGVLPLVFASGAGANSRHSLGTTVLGGMLIATLLSLFVVPVFYVIMERLREWVWGSLN